MPIPDQSIRHLGHSSFLLKLNGIVMIFDYHVDPARTSPGSDLGNGVIRPEALAGEQVYVFASHGHSDHFHPVIFEWKNHVGAIQYILSYDIPDPPESDMVFRPGEERTVKDIRVRSYSSTDAGLAFSIYVRGKHVYHSGDNAFWNWDGDLDDDIYERIGLSEIDRQTPMDIAFQVCDPRLDNVGDGGIHIFARIFQPGLLVPIHSFGQYEFNAKAEKRLRGAGFSNAYWCVGRPGQIVSLSQFSEPGFL
jgi:L-ascorbate metabolism protein UlaG (beta-lactamase superfamily)